MGRERVGAEGSGMRGWGFRVESWVGGGSGGLGGLGECAGMILVFFFGGGGRIAWNEAVMEPGTSKREWGGGF